MRFRLFVVESHGTGKRCICMATIRHCIFERMMFDGLLVWSLVGRKYLHSVLEITVWGD